MSEPLPDSAASPAAGEQPVLSVVVALYNARESVAAAIRSALEQDVDLEVVVVDDRSTDGSGDVVRELAATHDRGDRVRLVTQEVNGGAAAARNTGVRVARGRYVSFLDSDDEYLPTFASTLLGALRDADAQIAVGSVVHVRADGTETERRPAVTGTLSGAEAARLGLRDRISPFTCDKLVERTIFDGIDFPEGLVNEDFLTNPVLASRSTRVVVVDAPVYRYQVHGASVTWTARTRTAELDRSVAYLRDNLLTGSDDRETARAIDSADVLLTLLTGQRALLHDPSSAVVVECRRRLRRLGLRRALGLPPATVLASALLVRAPGLYRRLYRARVARLYGGL